ncbi:MAG: F0F1 ATP synthase subunit delta [Flavobacteriaceae bacterium]
MSGDNSIVSGVAGRYATALFELSLEERKIDEVSRDLGRFNALIEGSEDLQRLVRSPVFGAGEQAGAVDALLQRAGISGIAANFIRLIARNRRLFVFQEMVRGFAALVSQHRGEISAEVTSAEPLSAAQVKALKESLKKAMGKDVSLNERVDAALIGGLIVKVGSRMIDTSIRTKLDSLKLAMKEVG